jgi:hypothetical protein
MMESPATSALQALRQAKAPGMAPVNENKDMPMAMDKPTKELFIDRSLFAETPVKKDQEVTLRGKITTIGASIGFMPLAVVDAPMEEMGEEEFDEELDDTPPSGNSPL